MEMDDENDLDNLFNDYGRVDEPEAEVVDNIQDKINPSATGERVSVPTKRVVRNPRLKFNPERLCGERGIPVLTKHFENVKFKGKGYEKEDLNLIMSKLEQWTHRLFPSMKFEDSLRHIERLGKKRPVQTCLRKIRLNMPILHNDFIQSDNSDDDVQREENEPEYNRMDADVPALDDFDRLVGETRRESSPPSFITSTPISNKAAQGNVLGSSFGSVLTEEQKQRMEQNKILAAERRKARLAAQQAEASATNMDNPTPGTSAENQFSELLGPTDYVSRPNDVVASPEADSQSQDSESILGTIEKENIVVPDDVNDELGLDELMDLVDDDGTLPLDSKRKAENGTFYHAEEPVNTELNITKEFVGNGDVIEKKLDKLSISTDADYVN